MNALRRSIQTAGEILITLGVVVLLFLVYQLVWTDIVADQAMNREVAQLHQQWQQPQPVASAPQTPTVGEAFAIVHIPRLGNDYAKPVLEGTDLTELDEGVGHYVGTAMPGGAGNFALAGHRKTHGEPFRHLDEMRVGDSVVIETADTWYTYRITKGPFIVDPTFVQSLQPVPADSGFTGPGHYLTLTTCNPWWSSAQRMIVYGTLTDQHPKTPGYTPPALE